MEGEERVRVYFTIIKQATNILSLGLAFARGLVKLFENTQIGQSRNGKRKMFLRLLLPLLVMFARTRSVVRVAPELCLLLINTREKM